MSQKSSLLEHHKKANDYVMPAIDDYFATRILLLAGLLRRGLIDGHESIEKMLKAVIMGNELKFPKKCHSLETLSEILIKNKINTQFLSKQKKFLKRLDKHYEWRYYDGEFSDRSNNQSTSELIPIDELFISLYESWLFILPDKGEGHGGYLMFYIYTEPVIIRPYLTSYHEILMLENQAIKKRFKKWSKLYSQWYALH